MTPDKEVKADDVYPLYCQFVENNRTALLRVTLNPETRRLIAEDPPALPRYEFYRSLQQMTEVQRDQFISRMQMGYASACSEYGRAVITMIGRTA